jgi:poly-gamma-glutamate capsule biosynthesis protein CapA/YwtB (metallophosphatase superfamily)
VSVRAWLVCAGLAIACGGPEPAPRAVAPPPHVGVADAAGPRCAAGVPAAACAPGRRLCAPGDRDRIGEWRYALIAGPFEPAQDVSAEALRAAWQAGAIAATADSEAALAPALGARAHPVRLADDARPALADGAWAIVPADALGPAWSTLSVAGQHPLTGGDGPLVVPLCGGPAPARNIDPARLTTLVMSGTTAMTGRLAERIDDHGIADTIRYIQPFFASADLVHISNEVAFVRACQPWTGQQKLVFCARDRYIELLAALHARLIELTGNHLVDYGARALQRTIDMYAQRGWTWFGGGRTQIDATTPRLVEDHGNRLAFVGCNAVNWWIGAISPGPGVAHCDWPRMVWQVQELRRQGYLPIATVQHRELRSHAPPPDLVRDLRRLAEAGAVAVIGSQAHVAHPWDVHAGAYVHYGPGNILFAQHRAVQRDATVDKLYVHAGRLLSVTRLFTRTEHGQPRLLTDDERAALLVELRAAAAAIAPPSPWAVPVVPPASRTRPDALVVHGRSQPLTVTAPEPLDPAARYPLVVDLAGTAPPTSAAFVALRTGAPIATGAEIGRFMRDKYPIDAGRISIVPAPRRRAR